MGRFTDPIVNLLRSMGVLFSNPPSGQPNMSGINWDTGFNPVSLQAPDGSTKSFPGAVGPGTGDVVGPASAAIGSFSVFSATTGKLIGELTIAQFYELIDDRMRDVLQPGTNITSIIYDDALGTLTINAATQGGGGGGLPPNGTYGNIVVTGVTPGTIWTIANAQVVNSMFAPMAANSVKANITGGSAPPTDVLLAAFQAWIALVANNLTTSTTVAPSKDAVNTALGTRDAATALVASNLATHTANVANPHSTTAAQVGLGNVTNESKATMFTNPVMSGIVNLGDGAELLAATAMAALAIDVTKGNNTKLAIIVDSTFTYSALPAAGTFFYATFANTDSAAHVMTMPANTTDYNSGVTGTVPWILPAGTRRKLLFESDGTNLIMYGSTASPPALSVNVNAAKTFTLADANVQQVHPAADTTARVFTIPANASVPYPVGTKLFGPNEQGAGALTIAITTDTIALAGSAATTGSRTVATGGMWIASKTAPTKWMVGGPGVT